MEVLIQKIIDVCCEYYEITQGNLISKSKKKTHMQPRRVAQFLMYEYPKLSQQRIADVFGVTHSAVLNNIRRTEYFVECYEDIRKEVKELKFLVRLKNANLDNQNIFRHLTYIFMLNHPDRFVTSRISVNDLEYLAGEFKISEELLNKFKNGINQERIKERDFSKDSKGSIE